MNRNNLLNSVSLDELKQMYDNGMSCAEIAVALDVSRQTIYRYLQGHTNRRHKGGKYASRIPGREIHTMKEQAHPNGVAIRNSVNACLVVTERTISLKGTVGEYLVEPSKKTVIANIRGGYDRSGFRYHPRSCGRTEGHRQEPGCCWRQ